MKLFNSMNQTIEEFKPIHEHEVNMYVCGPTVYNYPHIGNARPIVVFDTLKRTFQALGYKVKMVSNYTDVDDKIIKVAKECGDVYFRVNSVESYGKLSNQQIDDLMVGARIDENSKKENPLDFTLWKRTDEGIQWNSPWSVGRPGWHTECVVMINKEFHGEHTIDIHGGGMDLKFPHHENEIAQSRAAYETPIANYWIHNGMVNIDGEKMSKSLGNVIWAKDMIEKIGGNVLRWVFLSAHYRSPLNINEEAIETAKKELQKVQTSLKQAYVKLALADVEITDEAEDTLLTPFMDAMQDDMNTPNAFAALFETVKVLNQTIRQREVDLTFLQRIVKTVETMLDVLGIENNRLILSDEDKELHHKWKAAVKEKDFATADDYRARLIEKGIL